MMNMRAITITGDTKDAIEGGKQAVMAKVPARPSPLPTPAFPAPRTPLWSPRAHPCAVHDICQHQRDAQHLHHASLRVIVPAHALSCHRR